MKQSLLTFVTFFLTISFVSAASLQADPIISLKPSTVTAREIHANTAVVKANFINTVFKKLFGTSKKDETNKADQLASASLFTGIVSVASIGLITAAPVLALAFPIIFGIGAIITGNRALKLETSKKGQAKTGKGLGIASLVIITVTLVGVALIIAGGGLNFTFGG